MSYNSKKIGALQPREKRYVVTLDNGLTLRVHPSGKKSFVLRICQNGKIKDVTLGHFPDLSLAQAKALARKKQKQYAVDPVSGYTVNDAYRLWKNLKRGRIVSYKDEKSRLDRYIMKYVRDRKLDEITAPLIINIASKIEDQKSLDRTTERLNTMQCKQYVSR